MKNIISFLYRKSPNILQNFLKSIKLKLSKRASYKRMCKIFDRIDNFLIGKHTDFISIQMMVHLVDQWAIKLDRDFDIIVGIPRSGLLVANLLSLKTGKPLTTPDNIKNFWCSKSIDYIEKENPIYLLIDDSYQTGKSMDEAIKLLLCKGIKREKIKTAALITSKSGIPVLDSYMIEINKKRIFEWNIIHKKMNVVSDMDGVICENPPENVRNDDELYKKWLCSAKPYLIPSFKINTILTSRIEKYREDTEVWLQENGVKYDNLIMSRESSREAQRVAGLQYKILEINKIRPDIYWESGLREAKKIFPNVQCPVVVLAKKIVLNKND